MQKSPIMTESLTAKLRSRPNKQNIRTNVSDEFHRKSFDRLHSAAEWWLACVYRNKNDDYTGVIRRCIKK